MKRIIAICFILLLFKSYSQNIDTSLDSLKRHLYTIAFTESRLERFFFTVIIVEYDSNSLIEYCNTTNALRYYLNNNVLVFEDQNIVDENEHSNKKIENMRHFKLTSLDSAHLFKQTKIYDSLYKVYEKQIDIAFIKDFLKKNENIFLDSLIQYDTSIIQKVNIQIVSHLLYNNGILSGVVGRSYRAFGELYYRKSYPDSELLKYYLLCN